MNKIILSALCAAALTGNVIAQNSKIKCYFNHTVNTAVSSGVNAVYLNGTFADTVAAYINRAKQTIDIAVYDFTCYSTSHVKLLATAVNNAYSRGVTVRWIYNGSSTNSGLTYINSSINRLGSPTTSGYGIMHNKFMVVDANSTNPADAVLVTGSYNWSDEQSTSDYNNLLIIQDQPIAQTYYAQFNQMWGGTGAAPNTTTSHFGTFKSPSTTTSFTVNGTPIQVYFSPMDNTQSHLKNSVTTANNEMYFGIYTFTDNTVATSMKTKYTGGVTGFGIMDVYSNTYTPYSTLNPVLGSNLIVYNGGSNSLYHNKILLVDPLHTQSDPQVCTGSFNWTSSAENSNDENLIIVHDSFIANQYYQSLCKNFADMGGTACPATTGIATYDFGQDQSVVYPNPTSGDLMIEIKKGGEKLQVNILDALGRVVFEQEAAFTNQMQVKTSQLPNGVYFVNISNGTDRYVQKVIKQ